MTSQVLTAVAVCALVAIAIPITGSTSSLRQELIAKYEYQRDVIEKLRSRVASLQQQIDQLSVKVTSQDAWINRAMSTVTGSAAFHVHRPEGSNQEPDVGQVVDFSVSYVDFETSDYDLGSSTYTCPETGYYFVWFSVLSELDERDIESCGIALTIGGLYFEGNDYLVAYPTYSCDYFGPMYHSAIASCSAGSQIRVISDDNNCVLRQTRGDRRMSNFGAIFIGA